MFNIVAETKYQAVNKDRKGLADPSDTSAQARKRAVLKVLGNKAFKPLEWAEAQEECRKKAGPMSIVKTTTYFAHEDGKPIAEAKETREGAKSDVSEAMKKNAPKAGMPTPSNEGARVPKKKGES